MNEYEIEKQGELKANKLFNKMCLWLNEAEIPYEVDNWESAEGRDLIVNPKESYKCIISFYQTGNIIFNYQGEKWILIA